MERELCRAANYLYRLVRIRDSRQLNDDATVTCHSQRGLCYAKRVDPAAHHLERTICGVRGQLLTLPRHQVEHYLGPALEVETELWGTFRNEKDGKSDRHNT